MKKPPPKSVTKSAAKSSAKPAAKTATVERRKRHKRRAEDRLPDFRDLVDNSVQGVLVHSNFKPLYANDAFAELFGYDSAKEIMHLPLIRPLVPAEMWARAEEEYSDLIQGRRNSLITRARGIKKNGQEIWVSLTERRVDWHGTPAVHVSAFDISTQMNVEHSLLKTEQHLRAILEVLPYPIYITRRSDGQLLFVNRKTCLLFQKSAGQLLRGKSIDFFVDPKEREDLATLLETLSDIRDVEVKMKTAQGREFTAEIAAIRIDYGNAPALLVALNDISQRKQLEAELFHEASTDALTGISNRRYFMMQAEQELRRSRRFARDLSVMMIDLDHFKPINDKYGHATGDAVLQGVVKAALESLRQSDFIGRLGGEEFAVILPETGRAAAMEAANRLRQHIAERPIVTGGGSDNTGAARTAIACTVSVGVAQFSPQDASIDDLLHRADQALYRAKHTGRDRVEMAD
jgi:diguanylate cyclase (GGDEF)-like protein/PAS domain S-box-containing protein